MRSLILTPSCTLFWSEDPLSYIAYVQASSKQFNPLHHLYFMSHQLCAPVLDFSLCSTQQSLRTYLFRHFILIYSSWLRSWSLKCQVSVPHITVMTTNFSYKFLFTPKLALLTLYIFFTRHHSINDTSQLLVVCENNSPTATLSLCKLN